MKTLPLPDDVKSVAQFSDCQKYRYALRRSWDIDKPLCVFIMLNPSTATAEQDDPTVAKCRKYATRWGFGELLILNLFAWRSTNPNVLPVLDDPVGPENNRFIFTLIDYQVLNYETLAFNACGRIICAWGKDGNLRNRGSFISESLRARHNLYCLKINSDGTPAHPLYLKDDLDPVIYKAKQ